MPQAQRKVQITSFQSAGALALQPTAAIPAPKTRTRTVPNTKPDTSAPPRSKAKPRVQTAVIGLILFVSILAFVFGMAYLYGNAQVTREGYRKAELRQQLRRERELARYWKHQQSLMQAPTIIETKAKEIGMVPATDGGLITVGEKTQ